MCAVAKTLVLLYLSMLSLGAYAQDTLSKIKTSGEMVLGYPVVGGPPYAMPSSDSKKLEGFFGDICMQIAEQVKKELKLPQLNVKLVVSEGSARVADLKSGKVDLQCGGMTITTARMADISFTYHLLVAGSAFFAEQSAGVVSGSDLIDKTIVVTAGSTDEKNLKAKAAIVPSMVIISVKTYDDAIAELKKAKAKAWYVDTYSGWYSLENSALVNAADFKRVEATTIYNGWGLGFKKDDAEFSMLTDRAIREIFKTGVYKKIYDAAFVDKRKNPLQMNRLTQENIRSPSRQPTS